MSEAISSDNGFSLIDACEGSILESLNKEEIEFHSQTLNRKFYFRLGNLLEEFEGSFLEEFEGSFLAELVDKERINRQIVEFSVSGVNDTIWVPFSDYEKDFRMACQEHPNIDTEFTLDYLKSTGYRA